MTEIIKLCIDLNVWCSALYADIKNKKGTACQTIVEYARKGHCPVGYVQIVISYGMLQRLSEVLEKKFQFPKPIVDLYINTIKGYAECPLQEGVQLVLGGGVIGLRDEEDGHVAETAIAGKASILITENFKDFISNDTKIIIESRHAISCTPKHSFHIAHPFKALEWIRNNQIPDIPSILNLKTESNNYLIDVNKTDITKSALNFSENTKT